MKQQMEEKLSFAVFLCDREFLRNPFCKGNVTDLKKVLDIDK